MWAEAEAKAENDPQISCLSNQKHGETFYVRGKKTHGEVREAEENLPGPWLEQWGSLMPVLEKDS